MATRVSDAPMVAPADYASRPETHEREDLSEVRGGGPGWSTELACGACGNVAGNVQIWHSWWCGRNGDATTNDEIRCARCGKYSLFIRES